MSRIKFKSDLIHIWCYHLYVLFPQNFECANRSMFTASILLNSDLLICYLHLYNMPRYIGMETGPL